METAEWTVEKEVQAVAKGEEAMETVSEEAVARVAEVAAAVAAGRVWRGRRGRRGQRPR